METKINYTWVGLFVVLLLSGLISFIYWLGKYGDQQQYHYYHVYMTESVAGLNTDAAVKYRGVNVGTVDHIALNPNNSEQVELLLKITHKTPVKIDTTATLKSFGLTGLAYIELTGGKKNTPLITHPPDRISVIEASPSTFARIDESLSILATKTAHALDSFNLLLNEENRHNISVTLAEIQQFSKNMSGQQEGLKSLIDNGVIMEKRITRAFEKIETAAISLTKMSESIENSSSDVANNMGLSVDQSLESFNQLLLELNMLARSLKTTTQSFKSSPTDFLFKRSQSTPGPGEEGYNEK